MQRNAAGVLKDSGLYRSQYEHDSCGVGFMAYLDGEARHEAVTQGLEILRNLQHRGAVGGDNKTGDGAGVMTALPDQFFRKVCSGFSLPDQGSYAVGMGFFPPEARELQSCRDRIEEITLTRGVNLLGWRRVPADNSHLGKLALSTEPALFQWFIGGEFTPQQLYILRRCIEQELESVEQFYICSLSDVTIVYKGLLTGDQVESYFSDLRDPLYASSFCIVHSRFSTNTLPEWRLAQPFRYMAHNGEFNTVQGNISRQRSREGYMSSKIIGEDLKEIVPIIDETGSDSSVCDNVLELFHMAGRSMPHVMMMMIPEAYSPEIHMSEDKRAFYEYHATIMEPWDGPAAVVFTDGRYIGATLDRNGLRPARYTITNDGRIILASETGVLDIPPQQVRSKGRLQPGKMFLVDLVQQRLVPDNEIKARISRQFPYRRWVKERNIELRGLFMPSGVPKLDPDQLVSRQILFGYTDEDLKTLMVPMAKQGQEAIGSMGNDTGLPVLSGHGHLLFSYFRQLFAQVTNPPIDPLREQLVMSLESYIENESNPLDIASRQYRALKLSHPILSIRDMLRLRKNGHPALMPVELDCTFPPDSSTAALKQVLDNICADAEAAARRGFSLLILSDREAGPRKVPVPLLLAAAGIHHHMIRMGLRGKVGIIVETGEAREVFHMGLYLAYGVDAICPYVAFHTVRELSETGKLGDISPEEASDNYVNAIKKGLLKTFSRMGISTLHSFFGSQIFEALGISQEVVDTYFTGTISRIGGIGLDDIASEALSRHKSAFPPQGVRPKLLPPGSIYRYRKGGEQHYWSPQAIYTLQQAVKTDDYTRFKEFTSLMNRYYVDHGELRSLMTFKPSTPIDISEVEPVEAITRRFVSAAMSIGSISREAHETIALAMNALNAKSNSGEGGEDPLRDAVDAQGNSRRSRIKQIASGRFGVTTAYVVSADELQIKMAQGAKPGEGGQLPGHKVSDYIANIRHTTPGVTLISPPPHHDIYSIEDLAQLILDLRRVQPSAQVSVKLVSEPGIGTIASGVAKARADRVLVSGQNGGTGASPLTAIRHTGLPWELGLAETQQSLVLNSLRERIILQTDGHLKTGRDLAIAALLGAEEFGFGTSLLICLGCVMMRKCHLNTCPVGVATQDEDLRKRFTGRAVYVERFLRFIAQELREVMAQLGFRSVDEMVGRVDYLLPAAPKSHGKASNVRVDRMLSTEHLSLKTSLRCTTGQEQIPETPIQLGLTQQIGPVEALGDSPKQVTLAVTNRERTIGAGVSGAVVRHYGPAGLPEDTLTLNLTGCGGQSFGSFLAPGITLRLEGEANDFVGKSLSGGKIIIIPPRESKFTSERNTICGNVVLYGATSGSAYIRGMAGERFAVRNSGADAVVEGIGDHGCEYMTGGTVVVLGATGKNFAAGMSGGIAYVYDPSELFDTRCNLDMVDLESVWHSDDRKNLKDMLSDHLKHTGSTAARRILDDWEAQLPLFVKVIPIDYRKVLERMRMNEDAEGETLSATEEVYDG